MGITVVQNTHNFETGLGIWNGRPVAEKTWDNFKINVMAAQTELKVIQGPKIQHAGFHDTNCLATQLRDDLSSKNTEMLAILQAMIVDTPATEICTLQHIQTMR